MWFSFYKSNLGVVVANNLDSYILYGEFEL